MLPAKLARVRFMRQTNLRTNYQHSVAISLLTRSANPGGSASEARTRSTTDTFAQSTTAASSRVSSIWVTGSGSSPRSPSGSNGSWHTS